MDAEFFSNYTVNGKPIEGQAVSFGHVKTLVGIGAGIPGWVEEHRIRDFDHKGIWECVSYPGLVDAVTEELEPIRRELEALAQTGGVPFDDIETAKKTPLTGLFILAGLVSDTGDLENWHDLGI